VTTAALSVFGILFWILLHYRHEHLPADELR